MNLAARQQLRHLVANEFSDAQHLRALMLEMRTDMRELRGSLEDLRKQVAALHQKYLQSPRR